MKTFTAASVKSYLASNREAAEARIAKWTADLAANPAYAMEWSDSVYDDAARIDIFARQLSLVAYGEEKGFDDEAIVAEIRKTVQRELLRQAELVNNRSTGQGKNLMDQSRVSVLAKLHTWLNDL